MYQFFCLKATKKCRKRSAVSFQLSACCVAKERFYIYYKGGVVMRDHLLRTLITWLCVLRLTVPVPGQTPAAPAKEETPVLRVATRLVQVNVIVQDKKGEPVADLTRDDFVLLEQGKEQPIRIFSVESSRSLPTRAEPLPADTFSNRLEHRTGVPTSVTVILLDGLNTRFEDQAYAKDQIIKFLKQLQPQDRVALYTLGRELRILHDFTNDAQALLRSLGRYKGRISTELTASEPPEPDTGPSPLDDWLSEAGREIREAAQRMREGEQRIADFYTINRAQQTLKALEAIANHLSRIPGRKNLIWVSGSFPFSIGLDAPYGPDSAPRERRTFSLETERTARALSSANLAIYPVDARGLVGLPTFSAERRTPGNTMSMMSSLRRTHDTMNILAERTGGQAFYNTNNINGAIRRSIEDSRVTYVLGYYPTHGKWDGKFHEITVKVKRPGLRIRHRRGYFAFAEHPIDDKERQAALRDAVWSPLDATALGVLVHIGTVKIQGTDQLEVTIYIDPRDITLAEKNGRWTGALDFLFLQRNAEGRELTGINDRADLQLKRETYEQVVKNGMKLTRHLELKPNAYQLRIVVRDQSTGALGSVNIPLSQFLKK
jgi:VWFA-related protein